MSSIHIAYKENPTKIVQKRRHEKRKIGKKGPLRVLQTERRSRRPQLYQSHLRAAGVRGGAQFASQLEW